MKTRRLLTYLAAVSVTAAAAGDAYAATQSPGVVSACVHGRGGGLYLASNCARHDRRLTWSVTGPAGPAGPAGAQGPPGPPGSPGPAATTLFAQVGPDGALGAASPGVRSDRLSAGLYELDFGRDITRCVASVQQGGIPAGPGGSSGVGDGAAHANIFGAGSTFANGFPTGDTVLVSTIDRGGLSDSSFQIAILC
jgi:hypothetical protein